MTVLICGGRNHNVRPERIHEVVHALDVEVLINGGSTGIDESARNWAKNHRVHVARVDPYWSHGPKAGPMRNAAMLKLKPDLVIAFDGGPGTADMVRQAELAGVEVRRV